MIELIRSAPLDVALAAVTIAYVFCVTRLFLAAGRRDVGDGERLARLRSELAGSATRIRSRAAAVRPAE